MRKDAPEKQSVEPTPWACKTASKERKKDVWQVGGKHGSHRFGLWSFLRNFIALKGQFFEWRKWQNNIKHLFSTGHLHYFVASYFDQKTEQQDIIKHNQWNSMNINDFRAFSLKRHGFSHIKVEVCPCWMMLDVKGGAGRSNKSWMMPWSLQTHVTTSCRHVVSFSEWFEEK